MTHPAEPTPGPWEYEIHEGYGCIELDCPASTAWHPTAEAAREEWEGRAGK